MNQSAEKLWMTLRGAGLVEGNLTELRAPESPWFVKVLLAFSGWLAAIFLFGFLGVGLTFLIENNALAFIAGSVLIGWVYALLRAPRNEFVEHLALAISLAGQALVIMAIVRSMQGSSAMAWLLVALLEGLLAAVMPTYIHRVFSAYISASSLAAALATLRMPYIFSGAVLLPAAWLWLNEFRFPAHLRTVQAVGYGLVLALIQMEAATALGFGAWHSYLTGQAMPWARPWMGQLLAAGVMLYVVWSLLKRHGRGLPGRAVALSMVAAGVIGAASMAAPGIAVGIVILLLGFAGGNRVLLGLGVASLLFYISSYYYTLNATLLEKSQTLFIVGLALLIARWLMTRVVFRGSEPTHAG